MTTNMSKLLCPASGSGVTVWETNESKILEDSRVGGVTELRQLALYIGDPTLNYICQKVTAGVTVRGPPSFSDPPLPSVVHIWK